MRNFFNEKYKETCDIFDILIFIPAALSVDIDYRLKFDQNIKKLS